MIYLDVRHGMVHLFGDGPMGWFQFSQKLSIFCLGDGLFYLDTASDFSFALVLGGSGIYRAVTVGLMDPLFASLW